jgi:hypothetical protein
MLTVKRSPGELGQTVEQRHDLILVCRFCQSAGLSDVG